MPKYKFERNTNRGLIIDKLSFVSSNKSQDFARDWLKDDPGLQEVIITQIDPKDPLHGRVTIDRL